LCIHLCHLSTVGKKLAKEVNIAMNLYEKVLEAISPSRVMALIYPSHPAPKLDDLR